MKQILKTGVAMVLLGGLLCGCAEKKETPAETAPAAAENLHHAEIKVKDYGVMTIELDANAAPLTVENFMSLAEEGFYDGLTFHRIMDGFMIQGGDPSGNGSGGSGTKIPGEFKSNGWDNSISHVSGTISMARAKHPDSASSQFFIMVGDATYLDGNYAAFGHVTDGLDVALQIAADAEPVDDNGTILPEAQPVIEYVKVLD
ncbi:MAG: peptidylprolyl isomerase [Solobacterium sp.]|nr:peptidylprolyl isomerase [Solobacterium sp.]